MLPSMRLTATVAAASALSRAPAVRRSSNEPVGGTNGNWRHRLLRFHLPITIASAAVMFLWMTMPLFRPAGHEMQTAAPAAQTGEHQMPMPAAQARQMADHGRSNRTGQAAGHQMPTTQDAGASAPMDHSSDQTTGFAGLLQFRGSLSRYTTATGYVAVGLLALTLLIGPINLLFRKRSPISSYFRRDVGIWTAIVSVVHVVTGLQVHGPPDALNERILRYFIAPDGSPLVDSFGLGNWTGLAATVIVVGLLAISSDYALRKLKFKLWKWLQRMNYVLFALVVAHAMYYAAFGGTLLEPGSPSALLLAPTVATVFVGQVVGVWLWRRRSARASAQPA